MINSKKPMPRPANENPWYCLAPAPRTAIKGQAGTVGRDLMWHVPSVGALPL